jgi:hypothetical protein
MNVRQPCHGAGVRCRDNGGMFLLRSRLTFPAKASSHFR